MVAINNLSYYIGGRAIFEEASLHIKAQDKIGLIGLNGSGKTTLLRLINGEYKPDSGEITKSNETSIGYLNQDLLSFESEDSILNIAMTAFDRELQMQNRINQIIHQIEHEYDDKLVNELTHLQEQFQTLGGYSIQAKAEEILEGIGFSTKDLQRPLREFSGGWRMRVMLAKLLLEKPSLLMLDEPTNHLDLPSIQWVEDYLKSYDGAVILVSHDKEFINNTAKKIVEVSEHQLVSYEGNYQFYEEEKALRSEIQKNAFENQQQKIKQSEQFINRFRAKATKARQVQSRIKALEKMDRVEEVIDSRPSVNFNFNFTQQSGRFIIELDKVSKAYGENEIFRNTSIAIERGDKIALIGANGKGKSTLLRIISGTEKISGHRKEGYNVRMAFYAQHQLESLNLNHDLLEEVKQADTSKTEQELRNLLGCFLFSGDEIFKKIKVLSGGEKSRVALAKTLISEANFLMLDEPTNHLDIQSVNILIQALQQYEGSFIVVSHDRHFISQMANKIWYIENQQIKEYPGTFEEYQFWHENNKLKPQTEKKAETVSRKSEKPNHDQKDLKKLYKKTESEIAKIESQITDLESRKEQLEALMTKPEIYGTPDKLLEVNQEYETVNQTLEETHQIWNDLVVKYDELQQELNT